MQTCLYCLQAKYEAGFRPARTVGYRGTLTLAAGGSLSGRTQLSKGASMVLNGDVVSTGDIVNAGREVIRRCLPVRPRPAR